MSKTISLREVSGLIGITPQGLGKISNKEDSVLKGNSRHFSPAAVRNILKDRGFTFPKKRIVFHCLKGGASKTTLAYNSAYRLSQFGAKVLLVDLDKQGNATQAFNLDNVDKCFVDVVTGASSIEETIINVGPHLDVLPSTFRNARLEIELNNTNYNPKSFYSKIFSSIEENYDFILFDLPPDLNRNTYLCTIYGDVICIPTNPDEFAVMGMKMTLESIDSIKEEFEDLNPETYIVWSKYDARETNSFHYITEFEKISNVNVMPVVIRSDSTFKNAQANRQSVFELKKKSNAKEDVDILARELSGLREFFTPVGRA